jgi:hypothetical protein
LIVTRGLANPQSSIANAIRNPNRQSPIQIVNRQSESTIANPNRQSTIGNP